MDFWNVFKLNIQLKKLVILLIDEAFTLKISSKDIAATFSYDH